MTNFELHPISGKRLAWFAES